MDKRELAYAKQTVLTVKDWDAFQHVLRFWSKTFRPAQPVPNQDGVKKN